MSKFTFISCVLWAAFLFVHVQCEEITKDQAASVAQECKVETGASDEDVEAMLRHELADSTEAKCLRACVMKKFQLMNDEGKLEKEGFMKFMKVLAKGDEEKEAVLGGIVDACADQEVPANHCEAAGEYQVCLKKQANEKGLAIPDL